jgi:hypothetical protein
MTNPKTENFPPKLFLLLIFGALIGGTLIKTYFEELDIRKERVRLEQQGIENARAAAIAAAEEDELKKSLLPLPSSGIFKLKNLKEFDPNNSPRLKVINAPGANALVKLKREKDGIEVISVFVRAGETVEVRVPLGSYFLHIASGEKWYGESIRFGPNTTYIQFKTVFNFYIKENKLVGKILTLTQVVNGNLKQEPLNANDF